MKLNRQIICAVVSSGALLVTHAVLAQTLVAQTVVPVRALTAPDATTLLPFGAIETVRALNRGGVLVNDTHRRQLIALDSTFTAYSVTLDSASENGLYYNSRSISLIPYVGDSTLFRDVRQEKYFVIDPNGTVVSAFTKKIEGSQLLMMFPPRGFDAAGNAITTGISQFNVTPGRVEMEMALRIVRANFANQKLDEITTILSAPVEKVEGKTDSKNVHHTVRTVNPMVLSDEWTVLSDGTLAVLRAKDYRVEMFDNNGKKLASTKIPYIKRRVSDDDKRKIIDSARFAIENEPVVSTSRSNVMQATMAEMERLGKDSIAKLARKGDGAFKVSGVAPVMLSPDLNFAPISEMADYYPPFRKGQPLADLDNNLWIATHAISASDVKETVYDVVNNRGVLLHKVRVPAGRSIVGFGRGGAVYVKFEKGKNEWVLERTHVSN